MLSVSHGIFLGVEYVGTYEYVTVRRWECTSLTSCRARAITGLLTPSVDSCMSLVRWRDPACRFSERGGEDLSCPCCNTVTTWRDRGFIFPDELSHSGGYMVKRSWGDLVLRWKDMTHARLLPGHRGANCQLVSK